MESALKLKPDAHHGTEWLHAAVLRAKLALKTDPRWLEQHTLTGIPTGGEVPAGFTVADGTRTISLGEIRQALMAHTTARLLFVKPKDPVAAALLKELARVEARLVSLETGLEVLDLADKYGALGTAGIRTAWQKVLPWRITLLVREYFVPLCVVTTLILLLYLNHLRKSRARLQRTA